MPSKLTSKKDEKESDHLSELCAAMMIAKTEEELRCYLIDLCTPSELRALAERWQVAKLLDKQELSYRDINEKTGVSTTTIGRVARFLTNEPHQGYRTILNRLKSDKSKETKNGKNKTKNSSTKKRSLS